MKKTYYSKLLAALIALSPSLAWSSGVPLEMSYQATVTDDDGKVISPNAPAPYEIIVRIYDASTGGNLLWAEKQTTTIFRGKFSIVMGNGFDVPKLEGVEPRPDLDAILTEEDRFTEITLKSQAAGPSGESTTFSPRQKLVATATALRSKVAESVVDGSITESSIEVGSLSGVVFKENAISSRELAPITAAAIENSTITAAKLAANSVNSSIIQDRGVTGADIANSTIESNNIKDGTIGGHDIADGSILGGDIADGSIGGVDIANGVVTSAKLAPGAGSPTILGAGKIKTIFSGDTIERRTIEFNPSDYNLPASGVNGAILKVYIKWGSGSQSLSLVFPGSDYTIPEGSIKARDANSVTSFVMPGQNLRMDVSRKIICPLKRLSNGNYQFQIESALSDRSNNWGVVSIDTEISVIGYY